MGAASIRVARKTRPLSLLAGGSSEGRGRSDGQSRQLCVIFSTSDLGAVMVLFSAAPAHPSPSWTIWEAAHRDACWLVDRKLAVSAEGADGHYAGLAGLLPNKQLLRY